MTEILHIYIDSLFRGVNVRCIRMEVMSLLPFPSMWKRATQLLSR